MLFDLIRKHEKSNVIFLSGDVHFANRYQPACETLTAYNVPDFTSSGMTHNIGSFAGGALKFLESIMDIFQDPNYSIEYSFHQFNYGHISVDTLAHKVEVSLKDIDGHAVFSNEFDLHKDLQFNSSKLNKNSNFCSHL